MKGPREPLTTQSLCGKSVSDYQIGTWWFMASKQLLSLWDTRCAGLRVPVCLLLGWRLVLGWGGGGGGRQPLGPFLRLTVWGAPYELTSPTGQTPAALRTAEMLLRGVSHLDSLWGQCFYGDVCKPYGRCMWAEGVQSRAWNKRTHFQQ